MRCAPRRWQAFHIDERNFFLRLTLFHLNPILECDITLVLKKIRNCHANHRKLKYHAYGVIKMRLYCDKIQGLTLLRVSLRKPEKASGA